MKQRENPSAIYMKDSYNDDVHDDVMVESCRVFEEERPARRDVAQSNDMFRKNKLFGNTNEAYDTKLQDVSEVHNRQALEYVQRQQLLKQ